MSYPALINGLSEDVIAISPKTIKGFEAWVSKIVDGGTLNHVFSTDKRFEFIVSKDEKMRSITVSKPTSQTEAAKIIKSVFAAKAVGEDLFQSQLNDVEESGD